MIVFVLPRKEKIDDFTIENLFSGEASIYHKDCGGGKVKLKYDRRDSNDNCVYEATCSRYSYKGRFILSREDRADICNTAIDGQERKCEYFIAHREKS